jgi:hypothetical protein
MSAFTTSHVFPSANTYEKVLLQLLSAYHFVARGVSFKLREPTGTADSGIQQVISRSGPYQAEDGSTRITFVVHFRVADDVESSAYVGNWDAAIEMTTATIAAGYIA